MILCKQLGKLLSAHQWTVLDLWAWDWKYSIFCASFWNKVIALDNESKENWLRPEYLQWHPNISFENADLRELPESILNWKYSLILLLNVVPFLKKKFFLELLLTKLVSLLEDDWVLALSFFFPDDETMNLNPLSFYTFNDFENFDNNKSFSIQYEEELFPRENHAPIWPHIHHIGYIEITKKH